MTDNYVKFISEQVHKEKVRGFKDIAINEGAELTSEDYVDMLHMYIEDLESHFEDKDLQQIQELSKNTLRNYVSKRADQTALASRDTDKATMLKKQIAISRGAKPNTKPFNPAAVNSYHRAVNKITSDKDSPNRPKVLGTGN